MWYFAFQFHCFISDSDCLTPTWSLKHTAPFGVVGNWHKLNQHMQTSHSKDGGQNSNKGTSLWGGSSNHSGTVLPVITVFNSAKRLQVTFGGIGYLKSLTSSLCWLKDEMTKTNQHQAAVVDNFVLLRKTTSTQHEGFEISEFCLTSIQSNIYLMILYRYS